MRTRRAVTLVFLALPPVLAGCGTILGIGDVELGPNDASVSPGGGDGSGVPPGDSGGTVTPETGTTGGNDTGTSDDSAAPPVNDAGTDAASGEDSSTGVCADGGTRCSGTYAVETCSGNGQWGAPVDCPIATPYCNGGGCGTCANGATTCSDNGVQTCDGGAYGAPVACVNSACVSGGCTGSCVPYATQCPSDAGTTPETCNANGVWQAGPSCAYVCEDGGCAGSCTPGAITCNGVQPQKCNGAGTWQNNGSPCGILCTNGVCTGSCAPGTESCSNLQPQKCTDAGAWQNNGSACPYVCDAGGCSGVCVPSTEDCSGDVPRSCSAGGTWQNGTACTYVCDAGSCGGVCSPGARMCEANNYVTCGSSGEWGTTETACSSSACVDGGCQGDCVPGSTECAGGGVNGYLTCTGAGAWGTVATDCSNTTCESGVCAGQCAPGQTTCNSTSTGVESCSAGEWGGTSVLCSAGETCVCTSGTGCTSAACECPSGDTVCGTTCTSTQTDPLNCGTCGRSCLGGTCSAGLCQPTTIAALYGGTFNFEFGIGIDSSNIYFTTGSQGQVGVCPLTGCTVTNPSGGATIPTYIYTAPAGGFLENMLYDTSNGNLYISDGNNGVIYSVTTSGSLNWTITGRTSPADLSTDGTYLYWSETSGIYETSLSSGSPVTSVYNPSSVPDAYGNWYDPTSGDIFGTVTGNSIVECAGSFRGVGGFFTCTPETSSLIGQTQEILVQGSTIFFGTEANGVTNGGGVFYAPVSNPSQIASLVSGTTYDDVLGLTADSTKIYFAPGSNDIYSCALGGCGGTATLVVSNAGQIFQLATDSQYLYWGTTEKVMRVAK